MYELKDNEKLTPVIFYTEDSLVHGKVVTTNIVRINIWLRSDSAPKYAHILDAQVISLTGNGKSMKLDEIFLPVEQIIAYHAAPEIELEMDYMKNEPNRHMVPMKAVSKSLLTLSGENRMSTQTEFGTTLEVGRTSWLSLYNVAISTPNMPQLRLETPMLLMRPDAFIFAPLE
jgi:hypothetical protein